MLGERICQLYQDGNEIFASRGAGAEWLEDTDGEFKLMELVVVVTSNGSLRIVGLHCRREFHCGSLRIVSFHERGRKTIMTAVRHNM